MKNFDITNFLLLNSSLKGLDKKKRTAFSLIGATSGGGLRGALPAIALGKAAAAKEKSGDTETRLAELEEENAVLRMAAQDLYNETGKALATHEANDVKGTIIKSSAAAVNQLGLSPVTDIQGQEILPGASVADPSEPASDFTKSEVVSVANELVREFAVAIRDQSDCDN